MISSYATYSIAQSAIVTTYVTETRFDDDFHLNYLRHREAEGLFPDYVTLVIGDGRDEPQVYGAHWCEFYEVMETFRTFAHKLAR